MLAGVFEHKEYVPGVRTDSRCSNKRTWSESSRGSEGCARRLGECFSTRPRVETRFIQWQMIEDAEDVRTPQHELYRTIDITF